MDRCSSLLTGAAPPLTLCQPEQLQASRLSPRNMTSDNINQPVSALNDQVVCFFGQVPTAVRNLAGTTLSPWSWAQQLIATTLLFNTLCRLISYQGLSASQYSHLFLGDKG